MFLSKILWFIVLNVVLRFNSMRRVICCLFMLRRMLLWIFSKVVLELWWYLYVDWRIGYKLWWDMWDCSWFVIVVFVSLEIKVKLLIGWRFLNNILVLGFFSRGVIIVFFYLLVKWLCFKDILIIVVIIGSSLFKYCIIIEVGMGFK